MPIYASPDTAAALGAGYKDCESRSLFKEKFTFFDATFDQDKRLSLDLFLPDGRSDIAGMRAEWQKSKDKQERNRAEGSRVNERDLTKACAALEASKSFRAPAPRPVRYSREWLRQLNADRFVTFNLQTASRLLVGLANGTLENAGCTLHPKFGFPVIPGSALKGVARDAAAGRQLANDLELQLFGGKPGETDAARQGDVCFLDAFAVLKDGQRDLEMDVLTPHYQNYSNRKDNAGALDEESPIPSVFPSVCQGVTFEFVLAVVTPRVPPGRAKELLLSAKECLEHALLHHGVGSKTAAGYGYFQPDTVSAFVSQTDLFPPPPKPVLSAEEEFLAKWRGKTTNTFNLKSLVGDLKMIEDLELLTALFDKVMPQEHLGNFRSANPYWSAFLREGGKVVLEKLSRSLPRQ